MRTAAEAKRAAYIVDGVAQKRRWRLRATGLAFERKCVYWYKFHVMSIELRFFRFNLKYLDFVRYVFFLANRYAQNHKGPIFDR